MRIKFQWTHEEGENQERWLVSYADLITLLFAFFVVLYATSEANVEKQKQFEQSIQKYLKGLPAGLINSLGNTKSGDDKNLSRAKNRGNQVFNPLNLPAVGPDVKSEWIDLLNEWVQTHAQDSIQWRVQEERDRVELIARLQEGNLMDYFQRHSQNWITSLRDLFKKMDTDVTLSVTGPWKDKAEASAFLLFCYKFLTQNKMIAEKNLKILLTPGDWEDSQTRLELHFSFAYD